MNKPRFLFPFLAVFSVLFIAISIFVIIKVNSLQKKIKSDVNVITYTAEVEEKAYTLLSNFDFYAFTGTNEGVIKLADESLKPTKDRKLAPLHRKLKKLRANAEVNISGDRSRTIRSLLFGVQGYCKRLIREKRKETIITSTSLSNYWNFTYYLIGTACLLALLLSYTGYHMSTAKMKIEELTKIKSLLLNKSIDVVVTCDKNGNIIEFNTAAEKVFGYSRKEVMGKTVGFLYADIDQAKVVREAIQLNDLFLGEIKNRKKNGEIFVSHLSANILRNNKGKAIGSMGVSRDITKQKELETNFQMIVNNIADIVYSCNLKGEFTFVNQAALDILGYDAIELIGKPFTSIIKKEDIGRVTEKYMNQLNTLQPVSYDEFEVKKKDGSFISIGQSVRLVMSQTHSTKIVGVHGIARSIDSVSQK